MAILVVILLVMAGCSGSSNSSRSQSANQQAEMTDEAQWKKASLLKNSSNSKGAILKAETKTAGEQPGGFEKPLSATTRKPALRGVSVAAASGQTFPWGGSRFREWCLHAKSDFAWRFGSDEWILGAAGHRNRRQRMRRFTCEGYSLFHMASCGIQ